MGRCSGGAMSQGLSQRDFRRLFPALHDTVWLDTAGSPPGCTPIVDRLRDTLDEWERGRFDWLAWDSVLEDARSAFARYVRVPERTVAAVASVTEAAALVAANTPPGRIVISDMEYRSMLWPFTSLDQSTHPVYRVPAPDGLTTTDDLIAAIDDQTTLVSVSEVTSSNGSRLDLPRLKAACERVGARLFVDVSQSLGALDPKIDALKADYVAVHGYKWMLAPRGAAWLVVAENRIEEMAPTLAGWKSSDPPHLYFGGELSLPSTARRFDTSPAWFSWIGAYAALEVLTSLDRTAVEAHVIGLSLDFRERAAERGFELSPIEQPSHISVAHAPRQVDLSTLSREGVRAGVTDNRLRVAFHYFVTPGDLDRTFEVIDRAR